MRTLRTCWCRRHGEATLSVTERDGAIRRAFSREDDVGIVIMIEVSGCYSGCDGPVPCESGITRYVAECEISLV